MILKEYKSPVYETEKVFDVNAGGIALFGRCWELTSPTGTDYSKNDGGQCKD